MIFYFMFKKKIRKFLIYLLIAFLPLWGCAKEEKAAQPEENPQQVVEKFFSFLKSGGRQTLEEAQKLTTASKTGVGSEPFRRWTEKYDAETEIKIIDSTVLEQPSKDGYKIAEVKIGFKVPSAFGGFMDSTSIMHLIHDKETNKWLIDFWAETIDEEGFKKEG